MQIEGMWVYSVLANNLDPVEHRASHETYFDPNYERFSFIPFTVTEKDHVAVLSLIRRWSDRGIDCIAVMGSISKTQNLCCPANRISSSDYEANAKSIR